MINDKRRTKRISVEFPVTVYLFDSRGKTRIGDAVAGHIRNFSPLGAALVVGTILLKGNHLFYACQDNPDIVLELVFELSSSPGNEMTVCAEPVWFDKDFESGKKQFIVGLKILTDSKSPEIKSLSKEICKDETKLVSLWKKIF